MQLNPKNMSFPREEAGCPAVLLLVFKRPDLTRLVLDVIRKVQPKKLYISSDGPNANNPGEAELVEKVRKVTETIDWDCDIKTNFHEENLGCRIAVSTAIDWFFEHEEEGIILEDDCLPAQSFFQFCSDLLEYYRDDKRVMCISGNNFQQGQSVTSDSYYFSKYNHCWGWATWRRAWIYYDQDMSLWPAFRDGFGLLPWSDGNYAFSQYWEKILNTVAAGKIDSWAYRWTFSCWSQNGLTCLPNLNLVKNIGFDSDATHTKAITYWEREFETDELVFPLSHPGYMVRNVMADKYTDHNCFRIQDNKLSMLFHSSKGKLYKSWFCSSFRSVFLRFRKL